MTIINHWGKWIDSDKPVTGVLSIHSIAWEWVTDDTCLTCEEITDNIQNDDSLSEEEKESELESVECNSDHTRIFGDWLQDKNGKYYPNPEGDFAAIQNETTVQVAYSKHTARGNVCSPCYPGQVDLDSTGDFLAYTLPSELLSKEG